MTENPNSLTILHRDGHITYDEMLAGRRYFDLYRGWLKGDNSPESDRAFEHVDNKLRECGQEIRRATRAVVLGDLTPGEGTQHLVKSGLHVMHNCLSANTERNSKKGVGQ